MTRILLGVAGIALILSIALLLSNNRRAIRLRVVGAAFALPDGAAVVRE
ncbi:Na+ dependent nucleoside transporter N-terminal domain-containing protein, partial [Erythrobacter donghaensis]